MFKSALPGVGDITQNPELMEHPEKQQQIV